MIIYREVTVEDAEKRSKELNVMLIETSAKAGHNVNARKNAA
jgi:Ras-related protein Rab-6A